MNNRKKEYTELVKHSFRLLKQNDPLILASSTAFFTTFAIAPIMLLLVSVFGLFVSDNFYRSELFERLRKVMGPQTANTIENILENIRSMNSSLLYTVIGSVFLFFVATTVLIVVQKSINKIWGITHKTDRHFRRAFKDRVVSFLIILFSGLLIFVSFITQTALVFIRQYLHKFFPELNLSLLEAGNEIVSFFIVVIWFAVILKYLPAGRIKWKNIRAGAFLTAILFSLGRFILVRLLPQTSIGTVYGTGSSVVLILLFIFYSAIIFYFGAAFTRAFAEFKGERVKPRPYAVRFKYVEFD